MKTTIKALLTSIALIFSFFTLIPSVIAQNIGINATGANPDNSALLDLSADDKGFLITRVDTADIIEPAFGLMTLGLKDSCLYMFSGKKWISISGVGKDCTTTTSSTEPEFPCNGTVIPIIDVTSTTGKVWMDRNLGASQVATSSDDAAAYGDLYQWGRCSDGHEKRTSTKTATQSPTDIPDHDEFITNASNWRSTQNDDLWQGVSGTNNPCPTGYRLPTKPEFEEEIAVWPSKNMAEAFASPLKLTAAGYRHGEYNSFPAVGSQGLYSSSTVLGTDRSEYLYFHKTHAMVTSQPRSYALSVRCIKD